MSWRKVWDFIKGCLPMRVWVVEFDGVRIGWGPYEDASADYESLLEDGNEDVRLYPQWTRRGRFYGLAESAGR